MTPLDPRLSGEERATLLRELANVKALFQARAIAAVMGLPQPTSLNNDQAA